MDGAVALSSGGELGSLSAFGLNKVPSGVISAIMIAVMRRLKRTSHSSMVLMVRFL